MNARAAAVLVRQWPAGVCHFCAITDAEVDGDRVRWLDTWRTVCSQPGCIRQFEAAVAQWEFAHRGPRKMSPAEVHELIREKAKRKRRQYREAAKARRKGRVA
jgi:hypothetical protein